MPAKKTNKTIEHSNPVGRPRIEMDDEKWEFFLGLLRMHCTLEECSSVLKMGPDTLKERIRERGLIEQKESGREDPLYANFSDIYKIYSHEGNASLRRAQMKSALNGNTTMLVWLGKQMLGQRDQMRVDPDGLEAPATLEEFYGEYEGATQLEGHEALVKSFHNRLAGADFTVIEGGVKDESTSEPE